MRLLITIQGEYGRRIVDHLRRHEPGWEIKAVELPVLNLPVVDDPEQFLPPALPGADLLLHLGQGPPAGQLVTAIATAAGVAAVIAPVDHSHWLPPGLRRQLVRELAAAGRAIAFPEPFCSLGEHDSGFPARQPHAHPVIGAFARRFGRPRLRVTADAGGLQIAAVEVLTGSPCGSTHYAAARIRGLPLAEAVPRAGLICLHYPCLASMALENRGGKIDTLMHLAGQIFNQSLEEAIAEAGVGP
ncbi:MAG: DUF166 family protein [bacterium]|nr:DUF166 family protein [bacterium]